MKHLTFSLGLLFALAISACTNTTTDNLEIGTHDETSSLLSKLTYDYAHIKISYEFEYNSKDLPVKLTRKTDGMISQVSKFSYNSDNSLKRIEAYFNDSLVSYWEIKPFDRDLLGTLYTKVDNEWAVHNKLAVILDEQNQPVSIIDYIQDSLGVWETQGSAYEIAWVNNTAVIVKNYLVTPSKQHELEKSQIHRSMIIFHENKEFLVEIESGFEEFYAAKNEYTDLKNPLYHIPFANIVNPENFNVSKYIPLNHQRQYANNEVVGYTTNATKVNEKGYPEELVVTGNWVSEIGSKAGQIIVHYEYLD